MEVARFSAKHILRPPLAARWVPPSVYQRGKVIFRALFDSSCLDRDQKFLSELAE